MNVSWRGMNTLYRRDWRHKDTLGQDGRFRSTGRITGYLRMWLVAISGIWSTAQGLLSWLDSNNYFPTVILKCEIGPKVSFRRYERIAQSLGRNDSPALR